VLISSHRKLLRSKAMAVNVAEKPEQDFGRHGWGHSRHDFFERISHDFDEFRSSSVRLVLREARQVTRFV
jgi:hypothetical protein